MVGGVVARQIIFSRLVQPSKGRVTFFISSPNTTCVNAVHPLNASKPISLILFVCIDLYPVQPANVL